MSETVNRARKLISRNSVTPQDAGCQDLLADWLEPIGFTCEFLEFGEVRNLWARRGSSGPLFVFAGHTDVVPPGPLEQWLSDPFNPEERDGLLYGRGAADMKGSIAAFTVACQRFVREHPDHNGSIALLITSDEEGPAINGTVRVVDTLGKRGEIIDWCVVGEPSSTDVVGDIVKNGRRGSLGARLVIHGLQGHVAYPHLAKNPVHLATGFLDRLINTEWDRGNNSFPPTSFQISNIQAGTGATNVIPGDLTIDFNFRYSTETTHSALQAQIGKMLDSEGFDYTIDWSHSGHPFLTETGALLDAVDQAVHKVTGRHPELSTAGGTSDGRFIAPTGAQVIELGPVNESIHKVNECVRSKDLETLSDIYEQILIRLLT